MKAKIILSLVVAGFLVSCNKPDPDRSVEVPFDCEGGVEPKVEGIIGGTEISKQSPFAKPIVLIAQFSNAEHTKGSTCTGTIIDDDIILTAGHCADSAETDNVSVFFTADALCDKKKSSLDSRQAVGVSFHKDFTPDKNGLKDDIALIRFTGGIPEGRQKVRLADKVLLTKESKILVAGFGRTIGYKVEDKQPSMRLRFGFVTPLSDPAVVNKVKGEMNSLKMTETAEEKILVFDQSNQNGVCAGDSGGPAFERQDKGWVQIGIASFVANSDGDSCGLISAHTSVAKYRDWIERAKVALRK